MRLAGVQLRHGLQTVAALKVYQSLCFLSNAASTAALVSLGVMVPSVLV